MEDPTALATTSWGARCARRITRRREAICSPNFIRPPSPDRPYPWETVVTWAPSTVAYLAREQPDRQRPSSPARHTASKQHRHEEHSEGGGPWTRGRTRRTRRSRHREGIVEV